MKLSLIKRSVIGLTLYAVLATAGCSGRPGAVATPNVDAEDAAQLAVEEYDRNADGELNDDELSACGALVDAKPVYDKDQNGALTRAEIAAGIASWEERGTGALPLPFRVELDGRPLGGAEVKLVPVSFLGDAISPASGVAGDSGGGSLNVDPEGRPANLPPHIPVIQPGLYRVEITHPTVNIPAKYNTESTLGVEAAIAGQSPSGVTWKLSSK